MLPFDNKSEFQVILNMPEGSALEQTARAAREMAAAVRAEPEVTDYQIYAGTASPFNFNGLVRHYFMRRGANVADIQVNLVAQARAQRPEPRHRQTRPPARGRDRRQIRRPRRRGRGAARPARAADPGRRDLRPDRSRSRQALAERGDRDLQADPGRGRCRLVHRGRPAARRASSSTRKRPRCTASAPRPSPRPCASPSAGHRSICCTCRARRRTWTSCCELPRAPATDPEELLGLRVRSGDANALPEPGAAGAPPLVPLRELVTLERDHHRQEHLPQEPDAGDLRDRRRGRRDREPGLRHPRDERGAAASSITREFGGSDAALEDPQRHACRSPTTSPSMKWDGEWHITIEVFRDLGIAFAAVLGPDLHADGRLVPILPHAADRDGRHPVLAGRHPARPRR